MKSSSTDYDVIIVGAGPAGLSAGIYTARNGLKTLILEKKFTGGAMAEAPLIENYPGLQEGIAGLELANRMEIQAKRFGTQINTSEKVVRLTLDKKVKTVVTEKNTYRATALVLSLGVTSQLGVPGEDEFRGKGVSYCVTCDAPFFKGKKVAVIGGGNAAALTIFQLLPFTCDINMIHSKDSLTADLALVKKLQDSKVGIIANAIVKEIQGDTLVRNVVFEDVKTREIKSIETNGVFVKVDEEPCSQIAKDAGVKTDELRYIIVDERQKTNIEGVYAAGDVTNCPVKQVGTAVGQGIIAAMEVFTYLKL